MTILDRIKIICEVDDTDQYDDQLMLLINQGISELSISGIPVSIITETDETYTDIQPSHAPTVDMWIGLNTLRIFDKTISDASISTQSWIDRKLGELFYTLKTLYDAEV